MSNLTERIARRNDILNRTYVLPDGTVKITPVSPVPERRRLPAWRVWTMAHGHAKDTTGGVA